MKIVIEERTKIIMLICPNFFSERNIIPHCSRKVIFIPVQNDSQLFMLYVVRRIRFNMNKTLVKKINKFVTTFCAGVLSSKFRMSFM